MNAIAPGMNVLATCESLTALDVFTGDAHEKLVIRLEEYVRALPQDMTTKAGQDAIRSLAAKISRTKTGLDDLGKDFVAALKKQTGAVDAQRKLIRDRLDILRDEVRNPLTAFEEAEANRISEHERLLVQLAGAASFNSLPTLAELDDRIAKLNPFTLRTWEEFADRATEALDDAYNKLNGFREGAVRAAADAAKAAADAAEVIELRAAAARYEAEKVTARLEAEKVENARIAAEQEAARVAEAVERERIRSEQLIASEAARAAQAVRDAEAAAVRAVEDERKRVEKVAADAAAAAAKLERNKKHRAKVHSEIAGFLMGDAGLGEDAARAVVVVIASGKIPHVSIIY